MSEEKTCDAADLSITDSLCTNQRLMRRVLLLRGMVERIGLFHADMNLPRECQEALNEDEKLHLPEDRELVAKVMSGRLSSEANPTEVARELRSIISRIEAQGERSQWHDLLPHLQKGAATLERIGEQEGNCGWMTREGPCARPMKHQGLHDHKPRADEPQRLDGADRHSFHADDELVRRWLRSQASRRTTRSSGGTPLWAKVSEQFCIGSTSAEEICRRHGYEPDLMVTCR